MKTVYVIISGKVQGVFYRASAKKEADRLHITGWIKNTPNGKVACTVTGEEAAVQAFIDWCGNGPRGAQVETVEVTTISTESFADFKIVH